MSELARRNGWRAFDNAGAVERVEGGWEYACDGMPSLFGCPSRVTVQRKWTTAGIKSSGWLVCYGLDENGGDDGEGHDLDVVLVFCPRCREVVKGKIVLGQVGEHTPSIEEEA